ncbi:hypothetical protein YC2023_021991 [Brassica napus]
MEKNESFLKTRFAACNFSEDDILISTIISQGVRTLLLSAPPKLFRLHAFFIQHNVEAESFPHTVTITSSDLASEIFKVRMWDRRS